MPSELDEFRDLILRVSEGSDEAAWQLVDRYGDALRRAVRRALDRRLRPKFDSMDFVQVVWLSFFRTRDRARQFAHPGELVAFLLEMVRNKVRMEARRRLTTERFNVTRECSFDDTIDLRSSAASTESAPLEVAIARERWDRIVHNQPDRFRHIVRMKLQGHTCSSIARSLQVAPYTVRRFLEKLCRQTSN